MRIEWPTLALIILCHGAWGGAVFWLAHLSVPLAILGLIPVIATIGADTSGQAYNINADTVAGAIAVALGAAKIVYLSDVPGLLADVDDASSLINRITTAELEAKLSTGELEGGMIPKISACVNAVNEGVERAHLLDGRVPHVVLLEIFTAAGIGTMITVDAVTDE